MACCCVQAQDTMKFFRPMLQEGKTWVTDEDGGEGRPRSYIHYIEGDTLIGDKKYKKVFSNQYLYLDGERTDMIYFAAIREENNRVYAICRNWPEEYLLYDFNIKAGGHFYCAYYDNPYYDIAGLITSGTHTHLPALMLGHMIQQREDSILVGGVKLRRLVFDVWYPNLTNDTSATNPKQIVWVEGVGSSGGLFYPWSKAPNRHVSCGMGAEVYFSDADFHGDSLSQEVTNSLTIYPCINHKDWEFIKKEPDDQGLFDLTGRHLAAPPARGLYIEGGRVRINNGK